MRDRAPERLGEPLLDDLAGPPDERDGRWPWRLPRRLTYVCSSIKSAPTAAELGIAARGVRTYKELAADVGEGAVERLTEPM